MTNQMSQNLSWFSQPNVSNHLTTDTIGMSGHSHVLHHVQQYSQNKV